METIGQRIETTRRRRVLTRQELASLAGMSLATVDRLAADRIANPQPSTIRKLAAALDVDPAWLLFGKEEDTR